jgi:hypothetical protein
VLRAGIGVVAGWLELDADLLAPNGDRLLDVLGDDVLLQPGTSTSACAGANHHFLVRPELHVQPGGGRGQARITGRTPPATALGLMTGRARRHGIADAE